MITVRAGCLGSRQYGVEVQPDSIGRCEEVISGGSRAKIAITGSKSPNRTYGAVV